MGKYIIAAIILYAVIVGCYLLWERSVKRKRNAARKKGYNPFKSPAKEDIIGKSNFILRHSKPQATTLEINEKAAENHSIFADENKQADVQNTPGTVPATDADGGLLSGQTGDNSGEIDIVISNEPEGEIEPDFDDGIDHDETDTEDEDEVTGGGIAQGLGFDELAGAVRTVENVENASDEQKEEAGRVLAEVRQTELIEQVAPDEPKKKIVSSLMDDYFTAYYRTREAQPQPTVKAPADFDVRSFAKM